MKIFKQFALLFLLVLISQASFSQSLKDLEQRKLKTQRELEFTSKLLSQTEKERLQSLNQLNLLKSQISLRKRLINDIENQISLLEREIEIKTLLIDGYRKDLENLKREYAKLIRFAWKNNSDLNIVMFIFASNDFNQAYRRIRFYQQFLKFRHKQATDIVHTQKLIEKEIVELSNNRLELANSRNLKTSEVTNLNKEEGHYSKSVQQLSQKEQQLRKELEERRKSMDALNKAIADLIAEEARKAAEAKVDKVRDARYLRLSDGFSGNKGKLPWPTDKGVIVSEYGEHNHPVLKGVKVVNNGVDISTESGAAVKSIFEGEVKKIVSIPGANIAVLIRHGDFLSVYSNLISVSVKVGDNVKALQQIGIVYTDPSTNKGIVNLQIWQENKKQNPTQWILP